MHTLPLPIVQKLCTCLIVCNIGLRFPCYWHSKINAEMGGELDSHSYCMHSCISLNLGYHALSDR